MSTNTLITLPDAVEHYFKAADRSDAAAAAACFTPDATVHDEAHDHVGSDAIQRWVADTSEKYQPQTTVLSAREEGGKWIVAVRVAGQFPGSPADLEFVFLLRDGKIAGLVID